MTQYIKSLTRVLWRLRFNHLTYRNYLLVRYVDKLFTSLDSLLKDLLRLTLRGGHLGSVLRGMTLEEDQMCIFSGSHKRFELLLLVQSCSTYNGSHLVSSSHRSLGCCLGALRCVLWLFLGKLCRNEFLGGFSLWLLVNKLIENSGLCLRGLLNVLFVKTSWCRF